MLIPPDMLVYVPLLAALVVAAVTDLRERRIFNWLTFGLALAGLFQSFAGSYLPEALAPAFTVSAGMSVAGLCVGFALTFILFAIGGLGGGDVKLLAAVGAWVGPVPVLFIFAAEAVIGMLIVLGQATTQGKLRALFKNSAMVAVNMANVNHLGVEHVVSTGQACRSIDRPLPYAVPVLLATLMLFGLRWWGV